MHCKPYENRIDILQKDLRNSLTSDHISIFQKSLEIFRRILIGLLFSLENFDFLSTGYLPFLVQSDTLNNWVIWGISIIAYIFCKKAEFFLRAFVFISLFWDAPLGLTFWIDFLISSMLVSLNRKGLVYSSNTI